MTATPRLTEQEALSWLAEKGTVTMSLSALGLAWGGVPKSTADRWVKGWLGLGLVIRDESTITYRGRDLSRLIAGPGASVNGTTIVPRSDVVPSSHGKTSARGTTLQRDDEQPSHGTTSRGTTPSHNIVSRDGTTQEKPQKSRRPIVPDARTTTSDGRISAPEADRPIVLPMTVVPSWDDAQRDDRGTLPVPSHEAAPPAPAWDDDVPKPSHPDPMAERLNAALETLSASALPTRMPVPSFGRNVVTMATGAAPVASVNEARFRLRAPGLPRERRDWRIGQRMSAVAIATFGALCAWEAWDITTWYGLQLSADPMAQRIYANAGQIFVLANVIVPMVCGQLAHEGNWQLAWAGRLFWATTIVVFCALASTGFSAMNLSDTTAVREATANQRKAIEGRLEIRRKELAALSAARAIDAIDVALQQAQPTVSPSAWRSSKSCTDVTAPSSGEACAEVLRLRQERATSAKRDALSAEIRAGEVELAETPKIADADPQVTMAARLISRIPFVEASHDGVKDLRVSTIVIGIEVLPAFLFAAATFLWFGRRRRNS